MLTFINGLAFAQPPVRKYVYLYELPNTFPKQVLLKVQSDSTWHSLLLIKKVDYSISPESAQQFSAFAKAMLGVEVEYNEIPTNMETVNRIWAFREAIDAPKGPGPFGPLAMGYFVEKFKAPLSTLLVDNIDLELVNITKILENKSLNSKDQKLLAIFGLEKANATVTVIKGEPAFQDAYFQQIQLLQTVTTESTEPGEGKAVSGVKVTLMIVGFLIIVILGFVGWFIIYKRALIRSSQQVELAEDPLKEPTKEVRKMVSKQETKKDSLLSRVEDHQDSVIVAVKRKMKKCIHPEHPVHAKKRKPLEIPDDAKYCTYCGLPQEDVLGAMKQVITKSLSELREELDKVFQTLPQKEHDIAEKEHDIAGEISVVINAQSTKISNLNAKIDTMAKQLEEDQNTIAKLCQVLLDITTKDPDMRKFGKNIQSFTSNLLEEGSEILFDECLNEGRKLVRISELVSESNTLLKGKVDSLVERIKGIADEARITGEDYKPMSLGIPPFEQYISQNAKNLAENSPIDMYLGVVQEEYTRSLREFAKKVKRNIDKWAIIRFAGKDKELEQFIEKDIPTLFKIIEAAKDDMESGAKSEIEAKLEELFNLSGLSGIDLASNYRIAHEAPPEAG
jgi:hypothetical protein